MNLFSFLNKGVELSGGRAKSREQTASEEAISQWKSDILNLQLFMWSNFEDEEFPHKSLRLITILTLICLAVVHRDKNFDQPVVRVLRGAISSIDTVKSNPEGTAFAVSSACSLAVKELDNLPWPSVFHAVTHLRKSNGL